MKFIHTSDWHLGRIFHERSLIEDQAHVLEELVALIKDEKPDALLVSGDIYDRSIPPVEAVSLLDDFLKQVVLGLKTPVFMISGNHDSAERMSFGSSMLEAEGLYVAGALSTMRTVAFDTPAGPAEITLVPYADPAVVRSDGLGDDPRTHDDALAAQIKMVRAKNPKKRSIVLAHAFVANMKDCESERLLSVGGASTVSADRFDGFGYAALGHLHRPQKVNGRVQYCGSLLKYSFSESDHKKGFIIGELAADGALKTKFIELNAKRDVRRVKGMFDELLVPKGSQSKREDYIEFTLKDKGLILDAMPRLREVYPNALLVRRPEIELASESRKAVGDHREITKQHLFDRFFKQVTGDALSTEEKAILNEVIKEVEEAQP